MTASRRVSKNLDGSLRAGPVGTSPPCEVCRERSFLKHLSLIFRQAGRDRQDREDAGRAVDGKRVCTDLPTPQKQIPRAFLTDQVIKFALSCARQPALSRTCASFDSAL